VEPRVSDKARLGPLLSAGFLLGAGLGGLVDGILLHQILQWHHMLSSVIPTNDLVNFKVNMFWDGLFDASVWLLTVIGLAFLWSAGKRKDVPWSGRIFLGSLLAGWGFFNLAEGMIDHQWLGLHHVMEYGAHQTSWDMGYLAFGAILLSSGLVLILNGRGNASSRGEPG
jgi:uncharacterized membrane protein